jgi:hypothetical protein
MMHYTVTPVTLSRTFAPYASGWVEMTIFGTVSLTICVTPYIAQAMR